MGLEHIQTFTKRYPFPVHLHRYADGPDVFVGERASGLVTLQITIPIGAIEDEIPGTAHALEHAKMKGQGEEDGVHPKMRELTLIGVDGNASTGYTFTNYWLAGPERHFERMFETLASLAFVSSFEELQVVRERGPITQEYFQREKGSRLGRWVHKTLVPGSGFERSIPGFPDTIQRIDIPALEVFNGAWYGWPTSSVQVVGGVAAARVHAAVEKAMAMHPLAARNPRPVRCWPVVRVGDYEYSGDDISSPTIELFYPGAEAKTQDAFILSLIQRILGAGDFGLLPLELRGKRRLVYNVDVTNVIGAVRAFTVEAHLDPALFGIFTEVVDEGIAKVARGEYPDSLFQAMFAEAEVGQLYRNEFRNHSKFVDELQNLFLDNDYRDIDFAARLNAVTREDISAVAKKYLRTDVRGRIVRLPK